MQMSTMQQLFSLRLLETDERSAHILTFGGIRYDYENHLFNLQRLERLYSYIPQGETGSAALKLK